MGYGTNGLTFNALHSANMARLPQFKNCKGELAHSKTDGSDWSPAQWLQAVMGELGEYANKRKKFERGDITFEEFEIEAGKELADVQTYLSILAARCLDDEGCAHPDGIDLGQATIDKFNEVSERVGSTVRLAADDWHYTDNQRRDY
jgi:NTP pyrophosphatase (non-canonical NTP hydrolase)